MGALLIGPPEIYPASAAATATDDAFVVDLPVSDSKKLTVDDDKPPMGLPEKRSFLDVLVSNLKKTRVDNTPPMGLTENLKKTTTGNTRQMGLTENLRKTRIHSTRQMGLTENLSPTFLSTGNPCLDFFFHVVPDTPPESVTHRLKLAWDQDPLKALKLVCNLRGVRGTGKSDKEGFYTAALWLHDHHPKTLAANVAVFAEFGYFKDLLEILFRVLEGADARKLAKEMGEKWKSWNSAKEQWEQVKKELAQNKKGVETTAGRWRRNRMPPYNFERRKYLKRQLIQSRENLEILQTQTREEKRIERAKRVVERFNEDPHFKFLHEQVSDLFAQQLRSDMEMLKSGNLNKISLASKWCPSLGSSFDRITLLCETVAKKVFPREEYAEEYEGVEEAHYAYRVRDRLRKEVLVPLRRALQLPEVYIGANDWGSLPYERVASVAMKTLLKKFFKHDEERFRAYLDRVKTGEAKIAAGALLPHEIIAALDDYDSYGDEDEDEDKASIAAEVAELQWKRMVDDLGKKGKLNNCLAVCDVSGSMSGVPMEVSVALGVLVSELSEEPWKGKLITFSANPQLQRVQGESLKSKTEFVRRMKWGMNTDFQKVFDVILQVAVKGKLKAEEMIKRLFVFSDMEFDQASLNPWETDYQTIVRKYTEKGYGECVPEIVFWNLRDSRATPVPANQPGVALVSGYSKNLMTIFLEEGGIMDPEAVMEAAISGKEYQKLVVVD
ncbi:Uncharacterized conserved protein UCP015417 [Perilla frutescens var. hirtella]|uniref:Uncharacterized conserved protein UCP015417 n=1 Tax=Perilla frutescens var. hirtella TaxID=608512 RepID=A0AAD4NZJ2_PERFH|nr:Uncharacterized conserved protein UCP015417 [Perilla frutescens var. frutescens]KAH6821453.1 Uncharacterized conserved protein UCP015417 [Perilla frutescens var. hirtella]